LAIHRFLPRKPMHSHGETNVTIGASVDLANVETMTKDANKASNARFTAPAPYHFGIAVGRSKAAQSAVNVKYCQIIAGKFSARGLSWGCSSEMDATGRVLYTADVYRKDAKRFTVIADEKLAAFLELERARLVQAPDLEMGCLASDSFRMSSINSMTSSGYDTSTKC